MPCLAIELVCVVSFVSGDFGDSISSLINNLLLKNSFQFHYLEIIGLCFNAPRVMRYFLAKRWKTLTVVVDNVEVLKSGSRELFLASAAAMHAAGSLRMRESRDLSHLVHQQLSSDSENRRQGKTRCRCKFFRPENNVQSICRMTDEKVSFFLF